MQRNIASSRTKPDWTVNNAKPVLFITEGRVPKPAIIVESLSFHVPLPDNNNISAKYIFSRLLFQHYEDRSFDFNLGSSMT